VLRNYRRDGSMFWNQLSLSPLVDANGHVSHFVGIQVDVSERVADRERLRKAALTDAVTGYANREGFEAAIREADPADLDPGFAVVIADIRGMQGINDTSGSAIGDALLRCLAQRCAEFAGRHARVGRVGGDELAVLLPSPGDTDARAQAQALLERLREPAPVDGITLRPAYSIGYTHLPAGSDPDEAVTRAEMALYAAKSAGHDTVRAFTETMRANTYRRVRLTEALREAVENDQFELRYQPKIDLAQGGLVGAEALLRWRHPAFGLQSPATFIPLAEASGMIVDIGQIVLEKVCRFMADLEQRQMLVPHMAVAINLSAAQFEAGNVATVFPEIVAKHGLRPERLSLEVTESVFAGGEDTRELLQALTRAGFLISLDDFGTGYSALGYLQQYPISEIKIDRNFVSGAAVSDFQYTVIDTVQRLAAALGCHTVAEGVDNPDDAEAVRRAGCALAQGFYYAPPLTPEVFEEVVAGRACLPLAADDPRRFQ
jgi:diguanylate cyclase (GGDEF)-like protein